MLLSTSYPSSLHGPCHHILPLDDAEARPMVVFFGAKDLPEGAFNFFQQGRELKAHRFFFNNGENHWYQYGIPGLAESSVGFIDLLERWRDALQASRIYMVGTSMGGYAAIRYGAALGADILAFSTDVVLNGPQSQSAAHFTGRKPATCSDLRPLVQEAAPNLTLIVGERDLPDLKAAQDLMQVARVKAVSMVGGGHIMPTFLSRQARLGPMLRDFIEGKSVKVREGTGRALLTEGYVEQGFAALLEARKKKPDWAAVETLTRSALRIYPNGEAAQALLGEAVLRQDRPEEAVPILSQALIGAGEDVDLLLLLCLALRRAKGTDRAKAICHSILEKQPGHVRTLVSLALTYRADGDFRQARVFLQRAVRREPDNVTYRDHLEKVEARLAAIEAKAKPKSAAKPKPAAAAKPTPAPKPAAAAKPAPEPKPAAAAEPAPAPKPAAAAKPAPETKPAAAAEPAPALKPAAEAEPAPETKPAAAAEPAPELKPAAAAEPAPALKPAAAAKPAPALKPAAAAEPTPETKPAAAAKPAPETKPAAAAEPAPEPKPAAAAEPAPELKPAAEAEPAPKTKPATKRRAATKAKPTTRRRSSAKAKAQPAEETKQQPAVEAKPATKRQSTARTKTATRRKPAAKSGAKP